MTPRKLLTRGLVFVIAFTSISFAEPNRPATSKADYKVALRFGQPIPLTQESVRTLYSKALELLETSNFTSLALAHEEYRQTVAGKYLLVSLKEPRKIKTMGGEVTVREIVIGLNRPDSVAIVEGVSYADYASSLFTIDDEGRVVVHAKYSGVSCIDLMKLVKKIAGNA